MACPAVYMIPHVDGISIVIKSIGIKQVGVIDSIMLVHGSSVIWLCAYTHGLIGSTGNEKEVTCTYKII